MRFHSPPELCGLLADSEWALAHFTLAADMTVLQNRCRFACSERGIAVRYDDLPFAALAFWGEHPSDVARLVAELVEPDESFYLVVNAHQADQAAGVFEVEHIDPEWQLCFEGDADGLDIRGAVELGPADLTAMQCLAADTGLMALEDDPFRYGPAFGIWAEDHGGPPQHLAAMAATRLLLPRAAEIGNVATRCEYRRRGLARMVVSALVRAYSDNGRRVFLMVFQTNDAAIHLYESMGFVRRRPMVLMQCKVRPAVT